MRPVGIVRIDESTASQRYDWYNLCHVSVTFTPSPTLLADHSQMDLEKKKTITKCDFDRCKTSLIQDGNHYWFSCWRQQPTNSYLLFKRSITVLSFAKRVDYHRLNNITASCPKLKTVLKQYCSIFLLSSFHCFLSWSICVYLIEMPQASVRNSA